MKKETLTTLLFLVFCGSVFSQIGTMQTNEPSRFSLKNLTYGGRLGASFGKNTSTVTIAPQIGYNFKDWFNAGFGIGYSYLSLKSDSYTEKNHYTGINIYCRAAILQYLLVQLQPEVNHLWWTTEDQLAGGKNSGTDIVPSFIIGTGIRQQNVFAMIYYDVVHNKNSPYGSTIGYSVGFLF